ncbi:MAG TPA: FG-GAP-like repeat-containing protein, partial [Myxococcota bacterium]|nr:FG-GAP-like repeat-containing protein [Myxococcota bacterium]
FGAFWLAGAVLALWPASAAADVPWPTCAAAGCSDPADFASYLFVAPGTLPNDYNPGSGEAWKYAPDSGMDITGVWESTTGRPDVVIAVLDSGNYWDNGDLARKIALNTGELPVPAGCASHDCNGDGLVSVDDFAEACAANPNGNGHCDGQDLIRFYSDGVDDDGNGFVDDIAGWDFADDDNDPEDQVRYGHGNGEASDEVAEANNGGGFPGFAPSAMYLPLKVADSFVAIDQEFARAVVYAVDRRVDVISEALGTVNASASGQAAVDYAYRNGIPLIASAADEESRHHNYPAAYGHVIWVNSVTRGDGTFLDQDANGFDLLNGCTNYSGKAWVAIPSAACSSEATSRAGGLTALLVSHAKNQIDRGLFSPYPGLDTPFSAEEVRQLLRLSARDVDHSESPTVVMTQIADFVSTLLSAPALGLHFGTSRFPSQEGWDQFTGYGRPDGRPLLALVTPTTIPPEADLTGGPDWFDTIDPVATPSVALVGSARAVRAGNDFGWELGVGCGVQPLDFTTLGTGAGGGAPIESAVLAAWSPADTAADCGFDPAAPITDPDAHTVTLRLRVTDGLGNVGEDRRTLAIHHDPSLRIVRKLGGSGESSPALADVNRDGVLDIVRGGGDGSVRAIDGATGNDLPGFPVWTEAIGESLAFGYTSGQVPIPHEAVIASVAADDLDGDGRVEIVAAGMEGRLYVFDDRGQPRPGFPVSTDPALSDPANRDPLNDTDPGIVGAPTLVDLDPPGVHPALEIAHSSLDGHLYAWRADGAPVSGVPVRLADRSKVSIDPATGRATPLPGVAVRSRAAKSLSSPAAGDLDGDGRPELVVATNEEYRGIGDAFAIESTLLSQLSILLTAANFDDLRFDTTGRVYAVRPDGNHAAGGPFAPGWPVAVPVLAPGVLPTVGTGTPGSPAIAHVNGAPRVVVFAATGPPVLVNGDGSPALGSIGGRPRVLAHDFPAGFPNVPPGAGSPDAPFFGALGAAAVGDVTGDDEPELVAPTGGLRVLLDVVVSAKQGLATSTPATDFVTDGLAHHQITAWDAATGALLPAFPRVMEDMQFIGSPALADVDGDGVAEILNGSGAYQVRAYRADGSMPAGWPKFTHGWHIASPTAGDVDGDGLTEIVAFTREGKLFVWDTPASATDAALPWTGFGRDRRNTQNQASGVPSTAGAPDALAGLGWVLEHLRSELDRLAAELPLSEARLLRRSAAPFLIPVALDHLIADRELRLAALLPGIENGLLLAIPELAPLEARFPPAVRATLERLIAQTDCSLPPRPGAPPTARSTCNAARTWAPIYLMYGDMQEAAGNPTEAVRFWAWGIALFDAV